MKNLQIFVVFLCACLLFSCNKEKEEAVKPADAQQPRNLNVPHFDEQNSRKVDWDQLPAELKNAIPVGKKESADNARVAYSTYRYYVGPWGGGGGGPFYIYPPSGSRIYAMAIRSGALVDKIIVWYQRSDGVIYVGGEVGGNGGGYYLQFFSPGEYIYGVGGRSGALLDQLTVYTNYKWFSYGGNGGSPFYTGVSYGNQILGFWGRSGAVIDQIGFYVYSL